MTNGLRVPLSAYIGRDEELDELGRLLVRTRLLTITGAGGCGKTRLAIQLANRVAEGFTGGVFQIDLASLREPALMASVALASVGLQEMPGRDAISTLTDFLHDRTALLVLDNCEHLVDPCTALASALLSDAAGVKFIATSRRRLGMAGEVAWRVPPLSVPNSSELPVATLLGHSAIRLFADRAQSSNPAFALTPENAAAVVTICRRLDGMPLAIELAAARINVLTPHEIEARLDDRFRLLTDSPAHAMERHRTLRATLDWSYRLLTPGARTLWNRLSVFAGGSSIAATEFVCAGGLVEDRALLDVMAELVDSSIVGVDQRTEEARYVLLETVREYGMEQLEQSDDAERLRERHCEWVADLAAMAEPEWRGPNQKAWLDRMERELDNVRTALEWCKAQGSDDRMLAIATALWFLWSVRGHMSEGRRWLETGLAMSTAVTPLRARALNDAGFLAYVQGDSQMALPLLRESLDVARASGDETTIAYSGARYGIGLLFHGDFDLARAQLEDSYARYRVLGDEVGTYIAGYELAEVLSALGEYDRAEALHHESLSIKQVRGDRWHIAFSLFGLGLLRWRRGVPRDGLDLLVQALQIRRELGARNDVATTIEAIAWVAAELGMAQDAATLLGAAAALESTVRASLSTHHRPDHDRCVESVRRALGAETFRNVFARGSSLAQADAVELAVELGRRLVETQPVRPVLTPREKRVASLVSEGRTNREIAAELFISERTAESHVEHIRNKLGFHSRVQIAAWAAAEGLKGSTARS